jgi:hypothetical protein
LVTNTPTLCEYCYANELEDPQQRYAYGPEVLDSHRVTHPSGSSHTAESISETGWPADSVFDAVNTFRVFPGRFAYFHVVSRSEFQRLRRSDRSETRVLRALVNAMKAEGARSVVDPDQTGTLGGCWPTEDG